MSKCLGMSNVIQIRTVTGTNYQCWSDPPTTITDKTSTPSIRSLSHMSTGYNVSSIRRSLVFLVQKIKVLRTRV